MNKFLQLCRDNAENSAAKQQIFVSNVSGQTLYIRGVIAEGYDANAADVIACLAQANPTEVLNIRFNTPGGDVFQGKEMAVAIQNYPGRTIAHIDSMCASAGTSVAIACDEVVMAKGAFFMIHCASTIVAGDKRVLRDRADLVEKIELSIVDDYTAKTGKSADELIAMMEAETWMTHDEALANGFVDRIAESPAKVSNTWNLTAYNHAPAELAVVPALEVEAEPPVPVPVDPAAQAEPDPTPIVNVAPAPSMTQANRNRLALTLSQ